MNISLNMAKTAYAALDEKKAENIVTIDISEISPLADYYIITNADNENQLHALVDNVEKKMKEAGYNLRFTEGSRSADWVLLDYSDIVIHVFSKEARAYYDLERIWRDGKVYETI